MPDDPQRPLDIRRLRERIGLLEEDRGALMAAIRHMCQGQLDDRFLNDVLRAELARSPDYGVLLESIEDALRCLRRRIDQ